MVRCNNCFHTHSKEYDICPHCGYYSVTEENPIYRLPHGSVIHERYILGETIGHGGFGITYKAWDMKLETIVAIKEYYPLGIVNRVPGTKEVIVVSKKRRKEFDNAYTRFLDEARNMAKFNGHANIVNVFEYFEENGTAYIVMELLEGMDLKHYLPLIDNKMSVSDSISIITEVCKALESLHKKNIIHRDISTDNIFLCNDGRVKVIDFGAARFTAGDEKLDIILKVGYAPPEQYDKVEAQGPWTDIYALGATMYRMVTGQMPEESRNRKTEDNVIPPHELDENIPVNVSNAIMKAMAVDQHMRFTNMDIFRKALLGEKKVLTLAKEKKRRKKRRVITILSAVLVLCIGYGVFSVYWNREKEAETLPEATIEIWYIEDEYGVGKKAAYEAIVAEFTKSYEDVTVNLKGIPINEYTKTINKAIDDGKAPQIYESTIDKVKNMENELAKEIVKNQKNNVIQHDELLENAKENGRIAYGFTMPIVYVNKGKQEVSSLKEAINKLGIDDINKTTSYEDFLAGNVLYYTGSNRELKTIQSKLAGLYKMFPADKDYDCEYVLEFSIGECDEDQEKCVVRFLEFCYSDNAQDSLFIQNDTGGLAFNKAALAVFERYNQEYAGFFDEIEKYSIN